MLTDIQQRIADIMRRHDWWLAGNLGIPGMPDQTTYKCDCGWNGDDPRAHVAEAITTELRLTQEWTWTWPEHLTGTGELGYGFSCNSREEATAEADDWMQIVSRWITRWERAK